MTDGKWDLPKYSVEVAKLSALLASLSPGALTTDKIQALVSDFPLEWQTPTFALVQSAYQAHILTGKKMEMDFVLAQGEQDLTRQAVKFNQTRELRAFWVGAAFLLIALAGSTFLPSNNNSALVLRITAGIGVGLMIAFLPGLFSIDSKIQVKGTKMAIRATGGFAGFAMVYLFDPGWLSTIVRHGH